MEVRIEKLNEKKLIGKGLKMSLLDNKKVELWRSYLYYPLSIFTILGLKILRGASFN
jgi:hypothetical protein